MNKGNKFIFYLNSTNDNACMWGMVAAEHTPKAVRAHLIHDLHFGPAHEVVLVAVDFDVSILSFSEK